jgi:ABC-2 type transport system ATP-binding protein
MLGELSEGLRGNLQHVTASKFDFTPASRYEIATPGRFCMIALHISKLSKSFDKAVLQDLSLSIPQGQLYALLGPNGAGKTTTLRIVVGLLNADSGTVEIYGQDTTKNPEAAKAITAWLPDDPMLYDKLTPVEYLAFVSGLWNIGADEAAQEAEKLLRWLELWEVRDTRCEGFSRGMKQKVALAGALIHKPKLLILDEPLTGLDATMARTVKNALRAQVDAGATVIITTHILEVAERLADRIGIISGGKLLAEGTPQELQNWGGASDATLEDAFIRLTSAS